MEIVERKQRLLGKVEDNKYGESLIGKINKGIFYNFLKKI